MTSTLYDLFLASTDKKSVEEFKYILLTTPHQDRTLFINSIRKYITTTNNYYHSMKLFKPKMVYLFMCGVT